MLFFSTTAFGESINTLPRVSLSGDTENMSKSERVVLDFEYIDKTNHFNCFAYTSFLIIPGRETRL